MIHVKTPTGTCLVKNFANQPCVELGKGIAYQSCVGGAFFDFFPPMAFEAYEGGLLVHYECYRCQNGVRMSVPDDYERTIYVTKKGPLCSVCAAGERVSSFVQMAQRLSTDSVFNEWVQDRNFPTAWRDCQDPRGMAALLGTAFCFAAQPIENAVREIAFACVASISGVAFGSMLSRHPPMNFLWQRLLDFRKGHTLALRDAAEVAEKYIRGSYFGRSEEEMLLCYQGQVLIFAANTHCFPNEWGLLDQTIRQTTILVASRDLAQYFRKNIDVRALCSDDEQWNFDFGFAPSIILPDGTGGAPSTALPAPATPTADPSRTITQEIPQVIVCKCGSDKCGLPTHSSWCPKNKEAAP